MQYLRTTFRTGRSQPGGRPGGDGPAAPELREGAGPAPAGCTWLKIFGTAPAGAQFSARWPGPGTVPSAQGAGSSMPGRRTGRAAARTRLRVPSGSPNGCARGWKAAVPRPRRRGRRPGASTWRSARWARPRASGLCRCWRNASGSTRPRSAPGSRISRAGSCAMSTRPRCASCSGNSPEPMSPCASPIRPRRPIFSTSRGWTAGRCRCWRATARGSASARICARRSVRPWPITCWSGSNATGLPRPTGPSCRIACC